MTKNSVRTQAKTFWHTVTKKSLEHLELDVCRSLLTHPYYSQYDTILVYLATEHEVSLDSFIAEALLQGKKIMAPRVRGKRLDFFELQAPFARNEFICNQYNIREPAESCKIFDERLQPFLVLVPGRAFSRKGERLGHGGGYYDRYLSRIQPCDKRTIGIALEKVLYDSLPQEKHDRRVDAVCTERGVYQCD